MPAYIDLTGQRFGKLVVLERVFVTDKKKKTMFRCACDCGIEIITDSSSLKEGKSKSCGCSQNRHHAIKFKKENPDASEIDILRFCLQENSKWNGECLESTFKSKSQSGYAMIKYRNSTIGCHRASWIVNHGKIPGNLWVLHSCDNPLCIRIDHLFLGTPKDNSQDMIQKNRDNVFGARKHERETVNIAIELRKKGKTYNEISKELNISISTLNSLFRKDSVKDQVKEFYAAPKYSIEIRKEAYRLQELGVKCKDIQKILSIPKRSLSTILNTPILETTK